MFIILFIFLFIIMFIIADLILFNIMFIFLLRLLLTNCMQCLLYCEWHFSCDLFSAPWTSCWLVCTAISIFGKAPALTFSTPVTRFAWRLPSYLRQLWSGVTLSHDDTLCVLVLSTQARCASDSEYISNHQFSSLSIQKLSCPSFYIIVLAAHRSILAYHLLLFTYNLWTQGEWY